MLILTPTQAFTFVFDAMALALLGLALSVLTPAPKSCRVCAWLAVAAFVFYMGVR